MKTYRISEELLEAFRSMLSDHMFDYDEDGESYNNDDIIELQEALEKEIQDQ